MRRFIILFCLAASILAAQTAGVMPDWEAREAAVALQKHTKVIDGLLNQFKPEEWVAQGAPSLYIEQLKQAKQFNSYLGLQAEALEKEPAKL